MKPKALVAEFTGAFGLCFVGILAIHHAGAGATNLTGVALAHGLIIAVLVAAFAATSGAHFNPAVSAALFAAKKIDAATFVGYVIAQIAGAAVGALAAGSIVGNAAIAAGTPAVAEGIAPTGALISEVIGTFFLVSVIFGVAVDKRSPGSATAPLFIGLTIVACILGIGPISGCAINPARFLGPALVGGGMGANMWVWVVGPLLGGILAGVLYDQFFAKSEEAASA